MSILRFMALAFLASMFTTNFSYAQTNCDDLLVLPDYYLGDSIPVLDTVDFGDPINAIGANSTITVEWPFQNQPQQSNSWTFLYISDSMGITTDAMFNITPNVSSTDMVTVSLYTFASEYNIYPAMVVNGDTSDYVNGFSFGGHNFEDFPMTVGNVDISLDTTLANITYEVMGNQFIRYGTLLKFEGQVDEIKLRFNIDLGHLTEVCVSSEVLDIPEIESDIDYYVYPNPTTDVLNIETDKVLSSIRMYDMLGSEVLNKKVSSTKETIDCSELISGIYMLITEDEQGRNYTRKVVVK